MNIGSYSFEEYINMVKSFHGSVAPGMVIGGFMVDMAIKSLPEGEFSNIICETRNCLPDSIQLLTPCTIGNGRLKIINLGRFSMSFYEKYKGEGIRIFLDPAKVETWAEVKNWYLKLKPKKEQDTQLLLDQMSEAGSRLCSLQYVKMQPQFLEKKRKSRIAICSMCDEAYPSEDVEICRACQGEAPYVMIGTTITESSKKLANNPGLI